MLDSSISETVLLLLLAIAGAISCSDPPPPPQIRFDDHFHCVEASATGVNPLEEPPLPFGETGLIGGTAAVDETGGPTSDDSDASTMGARVATTIPLVASQFHVTPWDFDAFVSRRIERLPDGKLLFDGDVRVSEESLGSLFIRAVGRSAAEVDETSFRSTVACEPATFQDELLNRALVTSFTYCFGPFENAALETEVVSAVEQAAWEFELAADINFVHLDALDGTACTPDADIAFIIRQGIDSDCGILGCPLASAFFPGDTENGETQELLFFNGILENNDFSTSGIIQHELGHALGLWHEQARYVQDDGVLSLDRQLTCELSSGGRSNWRGVTPPDPDSIMGYPYCRGTPGSAVSLSVFDRLALRYLYNLPAMAGRSFDTGETSDIAWYHPGTDKMILWYGIEIPNDLAFDQQEHCWDGSPGSTCMSEQSPTNWKPIPMQTDGHASILMYGPGTVVDHLVRPAGPMSAAVVHETNIGVRTAVPRKGFLRGMGMGEDVLFTIPGGGNGDLGLDSDLLAFDEYDAATGPDEFLDAAVGEFLERAGVVGDQVLWYREESEFWSLTYWTEGGMQEEPFEPGGCGLDSLTWLNAVVGNFDGDPATEILWYGSGMAVLWSDVDNCSTNWETIPLLGQPKVHPGDFTGDGLIDLAVERLGSGDEIWLTSGTGTFDVIAVDLPNDTVPLIGDFNGDACSDVLWYRGYTQMSPLWRSTCDGSFAVSNIEAPQAAAPIGYRYGHGRAYQ